MTKQSGKAPQTHSAATIAKPNTTIASNVFDTKAPLPSDSTLEVLVNGEKAFGKVYEAINNAQNSVEIVCWGFQPSMYFVRGKQEKNIGELLLQKAEEGKEIKIMCWQTPWGTEKLLEDNTPGRHTLTTPHQILIYSHWMAFLRSDVQTIEDFERFVKANEGRFAGANIKQGYTGIQAHYDWAWFDLVEGGISLDEESYKSSFEKFKKIKQNILLRKINHIDDKIGSWAKKVGNWKYDLTPDFLRNLGLEMNRWTSEAIEKASYSISHLIFDTTPSNVAGKIEGLLLDPGIDKLYEIYEKNGGTENLATALKNAAGEISRTDTALNIHEKIQKNLAQVLDFLYPYKHIWEDIKQDGGILFDDVAEFIDSYIFCVHYAFLKQHAEFRYAFGKLTQVDAGEVPVYATPEKSGQNTAVSETTAVEDTKDSSIPVVTVPTVASISQKQFLKFHVREIPFEAVKNTVFDDKGLGGKAEKTLRVGPSHHQKTVLIDYEHPERAVGFVMGHNMLEAYWDTERHSKRATAPDLGAYYPVPREDVSSMVTGGVLYDLNENFVRSWEKIPMGIRSKKEAEEFVQQRRKIERSAFKPDKTKGTVLNAQILCTQPEFGLEEIKGFYYRLSELSTSYLYIENQYFRWPPLAEKLAKWGQKMAEQGREDRLCVFVVTNTSKEGLGRGRINTDRMLDKLGRRDVMPGVGKQREIGRIKKELDETGGSSLWKRITGRTEGEKRQDATRDGLRQEKNRLAKLDPQNEEDRKKLRQIFKRDIPNVSVHICRLMSTEVSNRDRLDKVKDDPGASADERKANYEERWRIGKEKKRPEEIYIHSKVAIANDVFMTIGSANINTRSMQVDSELNVVTECEGVARKLRRELWRNHTGENAAVLNPEKIENLEQLKILYEKWGELMEDNRKLMEAEKPLTMSLMEFEMLDEDIVPHRYDLD